MCSKLDDIIATAGCSLQQTQLPLHQVTQILQPNDRRVAIIISELAGVPVLVGFNNALLTGQFAYVISAATYISRLHLCVREYGDLVRREWFAYSTGSGSGVAVTEVIANCDYLKICGESYGK